jgi:opacity protein-like surface antigen
MKITVGSDSATEDLKETTKSTEFGLTFGAGFDWPLGSGKIVLDVRYDLGLSDIIKPEVEDPSSLKTRTWLFMIGYSF